MRYKGESLRKVVQPRTGRQWTPAERGRRIASNIRKQRYPPPDQQPQKCFSITFTDQAQLRRSVVFLSTAIALTCD